jgi:hypothetical protein
MQFPRFITWSAVATISYWLLDHLAPDVLPKLPPAIELPVLIVAAALLFTAGGVRGGKAVLERFPRPWFPRPFWRVRFWLRYRPSIAITTATPFIDVGNTVMNGSQVSLMLNRNLSRLPTNAIIDLERAELVFRQLNGKQRRQHIYRPVEAGGFLALEAIKGSCDFVIVEFSAVGLPAPLSEAPDFTGDFAFELRGVRARVQIGDRMTVGELPSAHWQWYRQYISAAQTQPIEWLPAIAH